MCGVIRMFKIRNKYIIRSVGVAGIVEKMIENRLRPIEGRKSIGIVKRIRKTQDEGSRERSKPMKKWVDVFRGEMREICVKEEMVMHRDMWRVKIRIADPHLRMINAKMKKNKQKIYTITIIFNFMLK